jgi:hypothetical protein
MLGMRCSQELKIGNKPFVSASITPADSRYFLKDSFASAMFCCCCCRKEGRMG